jgi:hypothetical protein
LKRTVNLPGAKPGGREIQEETVDMSGYILDFRGKNPNVKDTVNTFHQILKVTLDSSGRKLQVTLNDSLRIYYALTDLLPEYATGYMGQTLNKNTGRAPFALFKGADGSIGFKNFTASVLVKNSIGAEGSVKVNLLEGENTFSKNKVKLSATPLVGPVYIPPSPFVYNSASESKVVLNGTNSNVKAFVENLPQWIDYDIDVETNPYGNVSNWKDFVFDNSSVDVFLRIDAPVSFTIGGLNLRDTQAIEIASLPKIERVKSATLIMDIMNDFPIESKVELTLLDVAYQPLGTVEIQPTTIAPGKTGPGGTPLAASQSVIRVKIDNDKADMLRNTRFVAIKTNFKGDGTQQKIYNTYKLKVKTSLQAEYEAQF